MTPGLYPATVAAAAYTPHSPSCAPPVSCYRVNEFPLTQPLVDVNRIHFKESPFYCILKSLSSVEHCPGITSFLLFSFLRFSKMRCLNLIYDIVMSTHRNSVKATVILSPSELQQFATDKTYRCMVYCAAVETIMPHTKDTEIAFPHQVELRVNDEQISGLNLRGLKNKPGSTRPADITEYLLNKKPNYRNEVTLTYALTQKVGSQPCRAFFKTKLTPPPQKFAFVVNLVKQESVDNLVEKLRIGPSISKEAVIDDSGLPPNPPIDIPSNMTPMTVVKKSEDSDLVTTASIMSLKCPLSTLRINLPIRSTFCNHIQCFDGTSFLQLQQQAPVSLLTP